MRLKIREPHPSIFTDGLPILRGQFKIGKQVISAAVIGKFHSFLSFLTEKQS